MSNITELRKYKESEEFQDIISKCKNREDNTWSKILEMYRENKIEWLESQYSNHDMNNQRMLFTITRLEEITSEMEGANILRAVLTEDIERIEKFLTLGIRDQYGITNSSQIFDRIDLLRWSVQDNRYFQTQLDGMIAALEKEEDEKPSLTANDAEQD